MGLSGSAGGLASTLLDQIPATQRTQFLDNLVQALQCHESPDVDFVAGLIFQSQDADAKESLLAYLYSRITAGDLSGATSTGSRWPECGRALVSRIVDSLSEPTIPEESNIDHNQNIQSRLCFCKAMLPHFAGDAAESKAFRVALALIASGDQDLSRRARDFVFAVLASRDDTVLEAIVRPSLGALWDKIQVLCTAQRSDKVSASVGYSLWFRCLSTGISSALPGIDNEEYLDLILLGLRTGDTERRKVCLAILRCSIPAKFSASQDVQQQHLRYCTVFETIVLGRYINQIRECEQDLNILSSRESQLSAEWLYVLLGAALDPQMEESNRKFIGNWVMRADLRPHSQFLSFLYGDFLPWAIQGHLYVSTLKKEDGVLRCLHGDRLSTVVERVASVDNNTEDDEESTGSRTIDLIIDLIVRKRNTIFPYALVYLAKGMRKWLRPEQRAKIADLSLHRLPEVARDYLSAVLCYDTSSGGQPSAVSRRRLLEASAIEKCASLAPDMNSLADLWSDLEHLEFPKNLLMKIPNAIFQPSMVAQAVGNKPLADSLTDKLSTLLGIAETRPYLLTTLICPVRKAMLGFPSMIDSLGIEHLTIRLSRHPPKLTTDMMLEEATLNLAGLNYEQYFGGRPSLGLAALFDIISRLHSHQRVLNGILNELLQPWKKQKTPPPTVSVWKSTLQLQVMLLCCEQLEHSRVDAEALLQDLLKVLATEPLPRYRYLLEWMCTRLCMKHRLHDTILDGLSTKDHHSNPKFLASLMKVGCILGCAPDSTESFALQLATVFVPLAASSKVVIRHEAQWQFPDLMDNARAHGWSSIFENAAFASLDNYIRSLERFGDPPPERMISRFDPIKDHTLTNLVEGPWFHLDHTEASLTTHEDFVTLYATDGDVDTVSMPTYLPLGDPPVAHAASELILQSTKSKIPGPRPLEATVVLQTKGTAYLSRALSDPSATPPRPTDLIVMASLVDNPYNLGGLSRVAEIFGAAALTLQNQNVIGNRDFTSVSVSSHLHFPIVQVSASGVPAWLVERKNEGFSVVGIEQTDRSLVLGSPGASLPEKAVLVVGSEKEGIPANVLIECDVLVEIPQAGITRSLNVQTAVAIVLYEHARQHRGLA